MADVFGGKERIENPFGIGDADAVIAKGNLDESAAVLFTLDLNARRVGRVLAFADGVVGVVQVIEKHLLQLVGVSHDIGQGRVEAFDHLNAVADEVVRTQGHGALQDRKRVVKGKKVD